MSLVKLLGTGVGPVGGRESATGVIAVFDGYDVECDEVGTTVHLRLETSLMWVGAVRAAELQTRLSEHALAHPALLTADVTADGHTLAVQQWVDAAGLTPVGLAQAVRSVRRALASVEPQLTALGAALVQGQASTQTAVATTSAPVAVSAAAPDVSPIEPDQTVQLDLEDTTLIPVAAVLAQEPVWGYVDVPTEVRGLTDTGTTIATLVPGQWYRLQGTANGWTHVLSVDGAIEGWAAEGALTERP
ncbi:MAG: hypothetical protein ACJA2H_000525 [Nitriliruptoraceae bacterium]|jgi:hypothetical protein